LGVGSKGNLNHGKSRGKEDSQEMGSGKIWSKVKRGLVEVHRRRKMSNPRKAGDDCASVSVKRGITKKRTLIEYKKGTSVKDGKRTGSAAKQLCPGKKRERKGEHWVGGTATTAA